METRCRLYGYGGVINYTPRDRDSQSHTMTHHKAIKKWVDDRRGRPATEQDGHAGILRIDFGAKDKALEEVQWEEFFSKFDEANLAFLYRGKTKDGEVSRFHKFVSRS
jgi:hypothetical protein